MNDCRMMEYICVNAATAAASPAAVVNGADHGRRQEEEGGFVLLVNSRDAGRKVSGGAERAVLVTVPRGENKGRATVVQRAAGQSAPPEGQAHPTRTKEGCRTERTACEPSERPRAGRGRGKARIGAVLRCPWCGERFERRASRQRFCCTHCRRQWDNMRGCAERERARMEREAEAEEQRFRDLARERIHAGLLPWPEGPVCRDGISPWERDAEREAGAGGIWENALLDPLPVR